MCKGMWAGELVVEGVRGRRIQRRIIDKAGAEKEPGKSGFLVLISCREMIIAVLCSSSMSLRDDITDALKSVPEADFKFVSPHSFQPILDRIANRFLMEGTRDLRFIWLWERFCYQTGGSQPADALLEVEQRLEPQDRYWFLASDEQGKYWVADASGSGIVAVLRQMYGFEYYIVDRHMNWLICENHHGMLIEASARPH